MTRLVWLLALALTPPLFAHAGDSPEGIAFFESKVRPVLVKECYQCHAAGAKSIKGGLRLDSRASMLEGGDSGPAVVPGKPDESPIIEAIKYELMEMPPRGKLPDAAIADLTRWVEMGAPDPRGETAVKAATKPAGMDLEAGREFWAYQPPRRRQPPQVRDNAWPINDVDRFILAALEKQGLEPSPEAGRATLIRRLSFGLTGLPPAPEEIDAFTTDTRADAYERLVDRLLDSPHFGERWGRHWLDVARFGESLTLRGLVFPEAWRYRDYVIASFNEDAPFDRFIREQIAGDLLPAATLAGRRRQRVATTFLVLGNTNLEDQDKPQLEMDMVDEQLDTIGKAILGQTIGCARCHDHKFDPIPTKDYYALAGILKNAKALEHANVSKWREFPLPLPPEEEAAVERHEQAVAALEAQIKAEKVKLAGKSKVSARGVMAVKDGPGVVVDDAQARKVGTWKASTFSGTFVGEGYVHDENAGKGEKTLTFLPELPEPGLYDVWIAYSSGASRAPNVPVTVASADGEKAVSVDMRAAPPIGGRFTPLGRYRFEKNGQAYVLISNEGTSGHVTADAVCFIPARAAKTLGPVPGGADRLTRWEEELKRLKASGPAREMVMSVEEPDQIEDIRVHIRGSVHTLGEPAPRGFLRVATMRGAPTMPSHESGRRELAAWLGSDANPLTARVYVNRAWHWLFGEGLARTTDNFGTTGEPPSHPELLDDLAARFATDDAWSVKAMVRRLVLTRAYRMASADSAQGKAADPENRLLWRQNRHRLEAECLRDTMLTAAGSLDETMSGPGFPSGLAADYGYIDENRRRSVYVPVFRNALPEIFEVFDFADPSMVVGRRDASTVAPQALFLMNHPFVLEQAARAADRLLSEPSLDGAGRVRLAYRRILGREPSEGESQAALGFVTRQGAGAWPRLIQALFSSIDFRYVN